MISRLETLSARNVLAMAVTVMALMLIQGCGQDASDDDDDANHDGASAVGNGDQSGSEANEADEHDEADEYAEADEHAEGGHAPGGEAVFTEPHTYAEAIHVIHEQLEKIESLIKSGTLDRVHAEAAVIRDTANSLAKFALQEDSGIPRDAIRDINLAAKALAETFNPIDKAGDSGDLAATQKVYDEMVELFETLEQYVDHDDDDGHDEDDDG